MSPGNGHPYSWSAIINGYDEVLMADCPFPAIPEYLSQQQWPDARISGARVTHVHAPEPGLASKIARSTLIPKICDLEELSEIVDAVLLARDDAENHIRFASRALQMGKPVFIDKPIALSPDKFEEIVALQAVDGLIFTCSALTFSPDFSQLRDVRPGDVSRVRSRAPKDWARYGMHAIEPVIASVWRRVEGQKWRVARTPTNPSSVSVSYEDGLALEFTCTGLSDTAFQIAVTYRDGTSFELVHQDTFTAFKAALELFLGGVREGQSPTNMAMVAHCVSLLKAGC